MLTPLTAIHCSCCYAVTSPPSSCSSNLHRASICIYTKSCITDGGTSPVLLHGGYLSHNRRITPLLHNHCRCSPMKYGSNEQVYRIMPTTSTSGPLGRGSNSSGPRYLKDSITDFMITTVQLKQQSKVYNIDERSPYTSLPQREICTTEASTVKLS
jgi:hypothetical protein